MNNIIDNIKNCVDTLSLADIYNITDILNERKEYLLATELLDLLIWHCSIIKKSR